MGKVTKFIPSGISAEPITLTWEKKKLPKTEEVERKLDSLPDIYEWLTEEEIKEAK